MATRIIVYLQDVPKDLTPDAIKRGIEPVDWWTLGEIVGLEEDAVNAFMKQIYWSSNPLEFTVEPHRRPVQISCYRESNKVKGRIDELIYCTDISIPQSVRTRLANVQSIVNIELGWTQLQTMYEMIAFEIAYWLAEAFRGVILSPDRQWYDYDAHRWKPISDE